MTEEQMRVGKRVLWTLVGCLVVSGLIVGTWAVASAFQSPEQREANASPPLPGPVFATVTRGGLADTQSFTGMVGADSETPYTLPARGDTLRSVITGRPPEIGATVSAGDVVTEVNGRPIFAVASAFDFYRDMGFGDSGPDVRALQETLVSRGLLGSPDGEYGPVTAAAVSQLYADAGYEAPVRTRQAADTPPPPEDAPASSESEGAAAEKTPDEPDDEPVEDAYIPAAEVLSVAGMPSQVLVAPHVGAHVGLEGTTDLTLGSSAAIVRAELARTTTALFAQGDAVVTTLDNHDLTGRVREIRPQEAAENGTESPDLVIVEFPEASDVLAGKRGQSVTVEVTHEVVAEDALLVPGTAVVARGGDDAVVVKRDDDGGLMEVPVRVLGSLRGSTAIELLQPDQLTEGDEVRVG